MRSVGLRVLKSKLNEYIRLAASGETVLVTDRGRVLAEIVPAQVRPNPLLSDAFFAQAICEGWLTLPAPASHDPPPRKPVMLFRELMCGLQNDRGT